MVASTSTTSTTNWTSALKQRTSASGNKNKVSWLNVDEEQKRNDKISLLENDYFETFIKKFPYAELKLLLYTLNGTTGNSLR